MYENNREHNGQKKEEIIGQALPGMHSPTLFMEGIP
jgi:hypothetical protein